MSWSYSKIVLILLLSLSQNVVWAQNQWSNYRSVEKKPIPPPDSFHHHHHGDVRYDHHYPDSRPQSGVTVIYQQNLPVQTQYEQQRQVFIEGQPLPALYRDSRYRVDDWAWHQLDQPLYGQHWIKVNDMYLLIHDDNFEIELLR